MNGEFKNLETLVALAGVQSSEKRCELLQGVTDLFFTAPDHQNSQEANLFCNIMQKVAEDLEPEVCKHSVDRKANGRDAPREPLSNGYNGAGRSLSQAERFINDKEHFHELNASFLVELLRDNKLEEFSFGFARLSDVDIATAWRILEDASAEALAIACKANRFDRATFSTIVLLTDMSKMRQPDLVDRLMQLYDQVTVQAAQRAMRFWRVRHAAENGAGRTTPNIHAL